ncbi:MAG: ABC transporter substrate-binding protein [Firmicutes bacterium]|jgi:D-methionine transport system substrate-binding protein|nr:ABC transporter substrate-binding protein [Bacillota bacterium]
MKRVLTLVLLISLLIAGSIPAAAQALKVGATPRPHAEILNLIKPDLAAVGIDLQVIEFTDYVQPNLALAEGDLDANYFQHIPYLENFSSDHRLDLTYTAKVHIEPMGAYSDKLQKAEDIKQGAHIAIPNDTVNGGRALLLLEAQGLIKLDPAAGITATVLDIVSNPLKLRFSELEAAQLPRVLPDVDLAIINTNFALEAGLDPLTEALFIEGSESPYVNVLAVRSSDVDREDLAKLTEALLSEKVKEFILAEYGGSVVPAF